MEIETVQYRFNWAKFRPGSSFFVPCIDTKAAREYLEAWMKRYGVNILTKVVIHNGVKGLRVWRV
jgi:hypothetical protein